MISLTEKQAAILSSPEAARVITTEQIQKVEAEFLATKKRRSKILVSIRNLSVFLAALLTTSFLLREPMSVFTIVPAALAIFLTMGLFVDDWYDENSPTFGVDEEANYGCFATVAIPFFLLIAGYAATQVTIHSTELLLLPALAIIVWMNYSYLKKRLSNNIYPHPYNCFTCCMKAEFNDTQHCPFCGFETKSKNKLQALKQHVQRIHPEIMEITSLPARRCSKCSMSKIH